MQQKTQKNYWSLGVALFPPFFNILVENRDRKPTTEKTSFSLIYFSCQPLYHIFIELSFTKLELASQIML